MRKTIWIAAILMLFGMLPSVHAENEEEEEFTKIPAQEIVNPTKSWAIKMSGNIEPSTFTNDHVYVMDESGERLTSSVQYDEGTKEGMVHAPDVGYEEGIQYSLVITDQVETTTGVPLPQGVKMNFKLVEDKVLPSDKSIHEYSKKEMEEWINKDADLIRLSKYPVSSDFYDNLAEANASELKLDMPAFDNYYIDGVTPVSEHRFEPLVKYMDTYYNRDYRTIDDQWIDGIKFMYRTSQEYNGKAYDAGNGELLEMFDQMVQDTKDDKLIMDSIFVTDLSMAFQEQVNGVGNKKIRGTQYIRYTSGQNVPSGLEMGKWYKRDIDVVLWSPSFRRADWMEFIPAWILEEIDPITFYEEVNEQDRNDTSTIDVGSVEATDAHSLTKGQLLKTIDKQADLEILKNIPVQYEELDNDLNKSNDWLIDEHGYEFIHSRYFENVIDYMDLYYNRDYRTIGNQYKKDISFFYKHRTNYRGPEYGYFRSDGYKDSLKDLFDQIVQDTKEEKRISESLFITDMSLVYRSDIPYKQKIVRGMQYIRYTSGTNLPEGVELNKWYKRAVDVKLGRMTTMQRIVEKAITWDTADAWYGGIYPVSTYKDVSGVDDESEGKVEYDRYISK
ncbi:hypothetical protein LCM20_12220 [Halobacillus litoralis]|uniref:hypothetical protein n=1 Tax=Halobacillus litoralis TaxID=45668 RepID=UPI001CD23553|nr:hypothetical protein [Halobacillus litoralis]MCA0971362.1 hypothetical protein [Halobacillus litoralis]